MQWFSLVILQANPSLQVPFTKNQYSSSEGIPSMQSAECQIILLCGLRNFSGMPHHLHRISLSSPTPAPIPCCIVYLVFYYLDYTFHISVCLCISYFYTFHLCWSRSISRVRVLPNTSPTFLLYCVFGILLSCPPLLQPHSPVV